jgi:hypothetical protein
VPPATVVSAAHIAACFAALVVFTGLSFGCWRKTRRILVIQVIAFSPTFFLTAAVTGYSVPPAEIFFEPTDAGAVLDKLAVSAALALAALSLAYKVVPANLAEPPAPSVRRVQFAAVGAAAVSFAVIGADGIDVAVISGVGRSAARESSPMLVAILGYFFPMTALAFARNFGTVANRWTVGSLAMSFGSILLGFRGLVLTAVAAVLIAAAHLADRRSMSYAKVLVGAAGGGLLALTLARPGADGGVYQALVNRVVFTPIYQIEKAAALYETVVLPGSWIWADLGSRIGVETVTLQQAVWRVDFPQSRFVGGSYPVVGDLVGNFGWYWWCGYILLLLAVLWWDGAGAKTARRFGPVVNDFLVLIAVRMAFFGLSAAYTPLALLCLWVLVIARRRSRRRAAGRTASVVDLREVQPASARSGLPERPGDREPHPAGVQASVARDERE